VFVQILELHDDSKWSGCETTGSCQREIPSVGPWGCGVAVLLLLVSAFDLGESSKQLAYWLAVLFSERGLFNVGNFAGILRRPGALTSPLALVPSRAGSDNAEDSSLLFLEKSFLFAKQVELALEFLEGTVYVHLLVVFWFLYSKAHRPHLGLKALILRRRRRGGRL